MYLQRPYIQIRSYSEVPGVPTSRYLFRRYNLTHNSGAPEKQRGSGQGTNTNDCRSFLSFHFPLEIYWIIDLLNNFQVAIFISLNILLAQAISLSPSVKVFLSLGCTIIFWRQPSLALPSLSIPSHSLHSRWLCLLIHSNNFNTYSVAQW